MGAVLPIAGTVLGTATQLNQMNAQRRAASEQAKALEAQDRASARNTELSMQEIERQRMYAGAQAQLQEQARLNNLRFEQNESLMNRQEAALQEQQMNMQAQMQNFQAQQQAHRGVHEVNTGLGQGNIQRDMQAMGENMGRDIQTRQLGGQQFGEALQDNAGWEQLQQMQQSEFNTGMEGLIGQYAQGQLEVGAMGVQSMGEAASGMGQLQGMAEQGNQRMQQGMGEIAQMRQAFSHGGLSTSDMAQMGAGHEQMAQEAIQRRTMMNTGASDIAANLELQQGMQQFQQNSVEKGFATQTRDMVNQQMMQAGNQLNQMSLNQYGRQLQGTGVNMGNQLNSFLGNQGRALGDMYQRQGAAMQNQQLAQGSQQAQSATDYEMLKTALDAGLTNQALSILESARMQRFELEQASSRVNEMFSDMAMSQQAFSQLNAGQAEQSAIRAQIGAVNASKPGFLSYAGALGQGAMGMREAMYRPPQFQPPQQQQQAQQGGMISGFTQLPRMSVTGINDPGQYTNGTSFSFQQPAAPQGAQFSGFTQLPSFNRAAPQGAQFSGFTQLPSFNR